VLKANEHKNDDIEGAGKAKNSMQNTIYGG
jgi:hypothetical protein